MSFISGRKKDKKSPPAEQKIKRKGEAVSGEVKGNAAHGFEESGRKKEPILQVPEEKEKKAGKKRFRLRNVLAAAEDSKEIFRERGGVDRSMLVIILLLICFGSIMVFSASYAYALSKTGDSYFFIKRQLAFSAIGIALMFGISFLDYRFIRKITPLYFGGAVLLLLAVLVLGVAEGEAVRWLYIGSFSIQPSEIMKLGLVLILAYYYSLTEKQVWAKGFWRSSLFSTFIPLGIVLVVCILVALEKHISGTVIMFAIGMAVIWSAGGKKVWFAAAVGGFGAGVAAIIAFTDYATKRLDIFRNPENYSVQSEVWQTLQGLYAVGSGGFFGVGLGNSRQKHLFVSQPQNDFIFAIVCEELGLIGAVAVIALFVAFFMRGLIISKRVPDVFSKLTVIGIVSKVVIQAFLNIAVVTNLIPNTGVSLPFFSYGGSALIILFMEMGVLLCISRYSCLEKN